MERMIEIWNSSLFGSFLNAICNWFGGQWKESGVVSAFVAPMAGREISENSIFFRLWNAVRGALSKLYGTLHLEKLLQGSIFLRSFLWFCAALLLAPLMPTMLVLALAVVAMLSLGLQMLRSRERILAYSPVNKLIMLYAGVYMIATVTSVTPMGSLLHGLLIVFFILFALVLENNLDSWAKAEDLVMMMVVVGSVVSAIGIGQYLFGVTGAASWLDSDMFSTISTRVYSTLENPNVLAEYLILMIPLGGAALLTAKENSRRLLMLVCCGLMCVCMILTFSRGGWLGLLIAGGLFVVLLKPRLMILLPFALIALYFVLPETVITRFTSIGNMQDGSTSYRVAIWMGTLNMLKDYWMCGVGPGTEAFNMVYSAYCYSGVSAHHSHNLFMQILCDGGVCAFVVFILVISVFSRCICGALSRTANWRSRCYLAAAISGVAGFMVQSMTDYTFYNYRVTLMFWSVLGLGAVFAALTQKEDQHG